mmetsp:Transcript_16901/g.50463  ORF Transcript_16901/g.50463 Transcript_16901/m.50463 type:complete len:115 (-) Transcript_16901:655-999(-)
MLHCDDLRLGLDSDPEEGFELQPTQVVGDAVQQAVAAAIEDGTLVGSLWDWHANVYTLVAITGVVLFWRGLWTLWDAMFGLSIISNVCSLLLGLTIITVFRLLKVPLLEGLPGG